MAPSFAPPAIETVKEPVVDVAEVATALTFMGAAGDPTMIAALAVGCLVPIAFFAATFNVYAFPSVKPATAVDVAAELKAWAVCAAVPIYGVMT